MMDFLLILACGLLLYLVVRLVARWLVRRERAACQARAARAAQREAETLQSYRMNTIPGRNGRVGDTATPWDAFVPAQADTPLPAVPHVYSSPSLVGGGGEFSGAGASVTSMKIELDGIGKVKMAFAQRQWSGDEVMQTAVFAGQEVMAITDDAGAFDLHYLGFKTAGLASLEEAKASAPAFVKAVLAHMTNMI